MATDIVHIVTSCYGVGDERPTECDALCGRSVPYGEAASLLDMVDCLCPECKASPLSAKDAELLSRWAASDG